jgi:serine protease Do
MDSAPVFSESAAADPLPQHPRRSSGWLPFLLICLLVVVVLALISPVMEQVEYSRTRGEVRALSETIPDLNLKSLGRAFSLVYRKVKPSVVHIDTTRPVQTGRGGFFMLGGFEAQGEASGVIIDQEGYIITNFHVVEGADRVTVSLDDGRSFEADMVGSDPRVDLAVLKINADGLVAASWGDSDKLEETEMVWAIGNPFGLDQTVTSGIVSAKERRGVSHSLYQEMLQTDVAINPGNSGGPLVDINGDLVGINTAIVGRTFQGISFAIPAKRARSAYEQIRKTGKVVLGYWGVRPEMPTRRQIDRLKLPYDRQLGPIINEVTPGSPAAEAGVEKNDIILQWNGQPAVDHLLLRIMIAQTPIGSKVPVKILRGGQEITLEATVIEQPTAASRP